MPWFYRLRAFLLVAIPHSGLGTKIDILLFMYGINKVSIPHGGLRKRAGVPTNNGVGQVTIPRGGLGTAFNVHWRKCRKVGVNIPHGGLGTSGLLVRLSFGLMRLHPTQWAQNPIFLKR